MAARAQPSRAPLPTTEGEKRDDAASAAEHRPRPPDPTIDHSRMSADEKHCIAMLLADLLMADLARRPPRE